VTSRANAIFVQIFRAKIPTGHSVVTASNSMGTSYGDVWITDTAGTGKWEWYGRIIYCGESGSFSTGSHVYLNGNAGTPSSPLYWYISYCQVYDLTKGRYDGLRCRYADEVKIGRAVQQECRDK
jgi:carbohydrate-binding cenC domain protein